MIFMRRIMLGVFTTVLLVTSSRADVSNRNEVRANLEKDGWSVIWGKNFTEADWARGLKAIALSIALENPGPFVEWFGETLEENFSKIERNLEGISRKDLNRWILQSLKEKKVITQNGLRIEAGFATYDRWDRVVYGEPRTRKIPRPPFIEGYIEQVEKKVNLPNWHQFYIRYRLASGNSAQKPGKPTATNTTTKRILHYTLTNESPYPVTLEFSPSGNKSKLAPGGSTKARSAVEGEQYPKVKAIAANGNSWERTIRIDGGEYRIIKRESSKIQIVP